MDDIIINKISIIENCLKRIDEEYRGHEDQLDVDYTKQDSIILNLQRTCEAAIDLATHTVRLRKLGIPQSSRDVFAFLEQEGIIASALSKNLQAMVGFRNIAVHNYQQVNLAVVQSIIEKRLDDFRTFINIVKAL